MRRLITLALTAVSPLLPVAAHAWGADGHQTVATLAARLIQGTPAEARVKALLGDMTLLDAAIWADCARGISPKQDYSYPAPGKYASCASLETPERIAEMADYVRRNDRQCNPRPGEESCNQQYHYTDVALQRSRYIEGFTGTSNHDVVGAMRAAILVLQGKPSPAPISFKSPREALIILTHLVGDVHEPLHVGAIYLDAQGLRVDPEKTGFNPASSTIGGNSLYIASTAPAPAGRGPLKFHTLWDAVPEALKPQHVDAAWLTAARALPQDAGNPLGWPAAWASQSLEQASAVFQSLAFSPKEGDHWEVTLPAGYEARADAIKRRQITLAGARLAGLLRALFPQ